MTQNASLEDLTTTVAQLLYSQNYAEAITVGLSAMKAFTPTSNLLGLVGQAFYHTRDFEEAAGLLQLAVGFNPHEFLYHFYLAHSLQMQGDKINAIKHYLLASDISPNHHFAPLQCALTLIMECQGTADSDQAVAFIEERAASDPNYLRHMLRISVFAEQLAEVKQFLTSPETQEFLASNPARPGLSTELRDICSVKQWLLDHTLAENYQELGPAEQLPYAKIDAAGYPYIKHAVPSNIPYIASLQNVSIIGDSTLIFDAEDKVIADILTHPEFGPYASMEYHHCVLAQHATALMLELPPATQFLAEGIMLSGSLSSAFGHWFSEFLPKLPLYEKIPNFADIPIVVDEDMPTSHFEYLSCVVPNRLFRLSKHCRLQVEKLWVAPTLTFKAADFLPNHNVPVEYRGGLSPQVMGYLRERVLETVPPDDGKRRNIYISRRKTPNRMLLNEDDVISKLTAMEFTVAYPQEMSFIEQACLFRSAKLIVAPSGSGLNNIIFADPGTPIQVIQTENYDWGMAIGPLMQMGYKLQFIKGIPHASDNKKDANFTVDLNELEAAINAQAGIRPKKQIHTVEKTKVFCIGRNKTGTTSIAEALASLGYKVGDQAAAELLMDDWGQRDFHRLIDYCKTADAFQDVPFSLDFTYPVLDYAFPGSKFILTIRNSGAEWYESLTRFHSKAFCNGRLPTADDLKAVNYREPGWLWKAHTMIYGNDESNLYHRENYIKHYEDYNARVLEYFKHRPQDLLVLNLSESDSMARLACFLGVEASDMAMPHLNAST